MNELTPFFESMSADLQQSFSYIPKGILWGIVFLPLFWLCQKIIYRNKKTNWKIIIACSCIVVYVYAVLNIVFFSREPGSRTRVDLHLFDTWKDDMLKNRFVFENIILFFPFGILFPCAIPFFRKGKWCVLAGCICSIGIEAAQYMTQRGHCQLDDVITNTLGTLWGWLLYKAAAGIWKLVSDWI